MLFGGLLPSIGDGIGGALDDINDGLTGGLGDIPIDPPTFGDDGPSSDSGGGSAGGSGDADGDIGESPELGAGLTDEEAETVAYLYEAGLNRNGEIDLPGLNFWIDQREAGFSERDLANAFLQSGEFEAAFGDPDTLSDEALVEVLYRNVLDREGEAGGIAFWTSQVAQESFDRADLLLAFAASAENVAGSPFVETLEETAPGEWEFVA
ncbi:MAG: DUF4214 domain-containing protein [Pseudomonadota bacterium]